MLDLVISQDATIRDALQLITETTQGIAFAVDAKQKLTGILTDGDIRRALLAGATLQTKIHTIMERHFVAFPVETPSEDIIKHLSPRITHIPLLDSAGVPVDYASLSRLRRIPVSEPSLNGNEMTYLIESVKTNWISSQGRFVKTFEDVFSAYHDGVAALTTSNGTTALHLALMSLGIGPGDEVIVPNLTFAASANAIIHAGATPVLVDIQEETWTLDPAKLRAALTPKTRAIMPVHLYGHPCDMDPILDFAKKNKLFVIEDCAESLGALYKGRKTGTLGDVGCFSFFSNKLITTGEGGMILFKEKSHWQRGKLLRDHGMDPLKRYWHTEVGYNYRLTNLQAAVGVAQMERIETFIQRKLQLAEKYRQIFSSVPGIQFPKSASWARNIYWLFTVRIQAKAGLTRDEMMHGLLKNGVETRPLFYPLHTMPIYQAYGRGNQFPVSEVVSHSGLSLPSSISLTDAEVERVGKELTKVIGLKELSKRTD
jgi:perosamine synthetase